MFGKEGEHSKKKKVKFTRARTVFPARLLRSFGWDTASQWDLQDAHEMATVFLVISSPPPKTPFGLTIFFKGRPQSLRFIWVYVHGAIFADYLFGSCDQITDSIIQLYLFSSFFSFLSFNTTKKDIFLSTKGLSGVVEALESLTQAELLDGDNSYYMDGVKQPRATIRHSFHELPDVLQLYVKRYEFNYDTMHQVKEV